MYLLEKKKDIAHDEYLRFAVCAKDPKQAFEIAEKFAWEGYKDESLGRSDAYFDDDIHKWIITEVKLEKPRVVLDDINWG